MTEKGRTQVVPEKFVDTVAEKSSLQAVLMKQDEIIDILKELMAKLDAEGAIASDYASLLTDTLKKVSLK